MKRYVQAIVLATLAVVAVTLLMERGSRAQADVSSAKPATTAAAAATANWVTVQDKREQAFSIAVPTNWKVYGGLFRFSAVDVRLVVDMTSPDGGTNLRVGDATVPPYTVPGPFIRRGPHMAPYASGSVFATKYGQARFGSMCQQLKVTSSRAVAPRYHPSGTGFIRTTGGEAYFSCTRNGIAMAAYVYAETTLIGRGEPGSNWSVAALGSLMAPADQTAVAAGLLQHSGQSLAMNPAWMQMQTRLTDQAIHQINASTQATIAATNAENARERAMISSLQNDSFNDVINGVSLKVDPTTGQQYETSLGTGAPQWINGSNVVVESGMSPGPGFSRLETVNR